MFKTLSFMFDLKYGNFPIFIKHFYMPRGFLVSRELDNLLLYNLEAFLLRFLTWNQFVRGVEPRIISTTPIIRVASRFPVRSVRFANIVTSVPGRRITTTILRGLRPRIGDYTAAGWRLSMQNLFIDRNENIQFMIMNGGTR